MINYIIRRLMLLPLTLFGVTVLIFLMISMLSPTQQLAGCVRPSDRPISPEEYQKLIAQCGLDRPIYERYLNWLGNLAHGNLGFSRMGKEPVTTVIASRLPATIELALWAIVPIVAVGVQLGILAALRHNQHTDQVLRIFSIVGTSLPTFVAGLLLLMLFAVYLGWLPTGDRLAPVFQRVVDDPNWRGVTGLYTVDALVNGRLDIFWDALKHLLLPVMMLSYLSWAVLLRVTRSSMLETLRQDFVTTARAKGLPERAVVQRHARPNAMLPVATVVGFELIGLLGGLPITESVFNWPGIGRAFVSAATNLDIITVLGFVLFNGMVLIVGNLVVDVLYAWLDPRVRLA